MNVEDIWQAIATQRRSLADLLDELPPQAWETPSLCARWRVRDVAAHVALAPQPPTLPRMVVEAVRAHGSFDTLNHDLAVRSAARPVTEIVADIRRHADSRRLPVVTNHRNILADLLVHGQDIALPLGLERPMPAEAAVAAAHRVWTMGWPFWARRRLRGLHLVATDTSWSAGAGPDVRGPTAALLLLMTGRPAALPLLTGDGVDALADRSR